MRRRAFWIPAFAGMTMGLALLLTHTAHANDFIDHTPQNMPPFVYEDASGNQHALSDERGHYVLLNVWATWCAPCVREMPSLDIMQENRALKSLHTITLSEDRDVTRVTAFYKTHAITHLPVALDHAGTAPSAFHLRGLPTTLLIDPQGNEIARLEGDADWSKPEIQGFLKDRVK